MVWDASAAQGKTPFEQNQDYLTGMGPEPTSNIVQLSQAPSVTGYEQGPSTQSSPQTGAEADQTTAAPVTSAYEQTGGTLQEKLLNPIKTGTTTERQNIQGLRDAFQEQAGPSRTWESMGGANLFGQAVQTGTGLDEAKNLLGTTYTGPQALDAQEYAKSQQAIEDLYGRSQALRAGKELAGYVQAVDPSQTPGKARYDAAQLARDAGWVSQLTPLQAQAKEASDWAKAQGTETEAFAKQRAQEESDIQKAAKEWTKATQTGIEGTWNERVTGTNYETKKKAVEDALAQLTASGQLPSAEVAPGIEAITGSDIQKGMTEAKNAWDTIMNDPKYAPIKDLELLQLTQSPHGTPVREPEGGWSKWMKAHPGSTKAQRQLMLARQDALEALFNPRTEGKYSSYMPLYGAGDTNTADTLPATYEMASLSPYATVDPGIAPNAANVATDEEVAQYNRIAQLLDQIGMTQLDPYRDPTLNLDTEKYLADEAARQQLWNDLPTEAVQDWWSKAKKAEREYDKNKWSFNPLDIGKMTSQLSRTISSSTPTGDLMGNLTNPQMAVSSVEPFMVSGAIEANKKKKVNKTTLGGNKPA